MTRTNALTYGLTHLAVAVKDLQKTKAFYEAVFSMEVMYEEANFIQLTTPGTHDILVFELNPKANGNSGGIAQSHQPSARSAGR